MNAELQRIARELDEAHVPREVWIGTGSVADRVTWLIRRLEVRDRAATTRQERIEQLVDHLREHNCQHETE